MGYWRRRLPRTRVIVGTNVVTGLPVRVRVVTIWGRISQTWAAWRGPR